MAASGAAADGSVGFAGTVSFTDVGGVTQALVHNADTCAAMQTAVQTAATARYNHGLVYATDLQYNPTTQVGNPWASLPSYWGALVGTVQAVNAGTALPSC